MFELIAVAFISVFASMPMVVFLMAHIEKKCDQEMEQMNIKL